MPLTLGLVGSAIAALRTMAPRLGSCSTAARAAGLCPPVTFFRKRDFRTASEIDQERYALKALRGDFGIPPAGADRARAALQAVRA